jgi:chromosome segregation ATPase
MTLGSSLGGPFGLVAAAIAGVLIGFAAGLRRRRPSVRLPAPADDEVHARFTAAQQMLDDTRTHLREAEKELRRTREELVQAQAEAFRISGRAKAMTDRSETEMGRLESAAIVALESAAASHRAQVADLTQELDRVRETVRGLEQQLDGERRTSAQLETALAERDRRLSRATGAPAAGAPVRGEP